MANHWGLICSDMDSFPGMSQRQMVSMLSEHFGDCWESYDEWVGCLPMDQDEFEPQFDIKCCGSRRKSTVSRVGRVSRRFEGHVSRQPFKITGRWLKTHFPGRYSGGGANVRHGNHSKEVSDTLLPGCSTFSSTLGGDVDLSDANLHMPTRGDTAISEDPP